MVLVSGFAITQGAYRIEWSAIWHHSLSFTDSQILWQIRMPRLISALLVGAALAGAGTVMQALFRNPLADPGLLGVASGASVAVGLVIVLGPMLLASVSVAQIPHWVTAYLNSGAAFIGALVTCALIFKIAQRGGQVVVVHLLLAGIAINALAGAATGLLTYFSTDEQLRTLTFWAMGNLGGARWSHIMVMASLLLPAFILLSRYAMKLNLLLLGDEEARYAGLDTEQVKKRLIAITALIVGITVAFAGLIGFVGLMVPHLVRLVMGADNRKVLPCSILLGATLLAGADTLARVLVIPAELPVGLVTSLLGGPFFLWLLIRTMQGQSR